MTTQKKIVAALACATSLVAGCAPAPVAHQPTSWRVHQTLVDPASPSHDPTRYEIDNEECNGLAAQRPVGQATADGAVGGLVVGALFGAIVGAAYDDVGYGAAYGAALGTATGAVQGAAAGVSTHQTIVRECMRGRGYRVLD